MDLSSVAAHALALSRRGLSVIAVPRPRAGALPGLPGDGKVPAIAWREFQSRRPTEQEIALWFGGLPQNLAIVTGAISGVVVVDADSPAALRWCTRHLPYTPWQTHTARGYHLFYRHPGVRVANRARIETRDGHLAIDVRGDGGYVIGPSSLHASGAVYQYAGDWTVERDQLPVFRASWLQRAPGTTRRETNRSRPAGDVIERARRYLRSVPRPEIGAGSDVATLSAACRLVRGFALSDADTIALLWDWAGGRPGWTREWIARKVAHAERYGSEPIGAYR